MQNRMDVLFYLSKKRQNKKGTAPVYCRITVNGQRAPDFSTGIFIKPETWMNGSINHIDRQHQVYDGMIAGMKGDALEIFYQLKRKYSEITAPQIVRILKGEQTIETPFLFALNKYMKWYEGEENALNTITKQQGLVKNIKKFLRETARNNILAREFRISIAEEMVQWLKKTLKTCGNSHASRHVELCRNVLKKAVGAGLIEINPLTEVEARRDMPGIPITCEKEEVEKIMQHNFESTYLLHARDLYLYQCGCGLAFAELTRYRIEQEQGIEWITCSRKKKTRKGIEFIPYSVPIFPLAKVILDKYEGKLPLMKNQPYNRALKEIAAICGIKKNLTTHTGRKTFSTLKDQEGWSLESVSRMLGHSRTSTTETYYINRSRKRVANELKERLNAA
jgi:integrase/recombinase XerD